MKPSELNNLELAQLLEEAARRLRAAETKPKPKLPPPTGGKFSISMLPPDDAAGTTWTEVDRIYGFDHKFPEVHEHFDELVVYEGRDSQGPMRLAVGSPRERMDIYGRERGWLSVWRVDNGTPRELRAVFVDTDDFESTGDRISVIYGKDGRGKGSYGPKERHELPTFYSEGRVEVHRDRCRGPYARNRLALVANDDDLELILNHALRNERLRG